MKTVENQMKVANEVLRKLELLDSAAILAGGAPRDWYFGNLATDLDFFVCWGAQYQNQKSRYLFQLGLLGFRNITVKTGDGLPMNYKRNPHLITVLEFEYKREKCQVMFMNESTYKTVVPLFPFGICQAWYKWEYEDNGQWCNRTGIQVTPLFEESVKHKVLRLVNDLYNDADGYVEKIRNKFPDYLYIGK